MKIILPVLTVCLLTILVATSCSKQTGAVPVSSGHGLIKATKVPCGPGCSAEAWLLSINESAVYEPVNLPDKFKIHDFAVDVMIREQPGSGITGNRAVELLRIMPR